MITKTFAKLNLNLHVLPHQLANGYSEIKFLNCRLSLFDELNFFNQKNKIELVDNSGIPVKKNLVYQAAALLREEVGNKNLGAKIKLIKNIPVKTGLGGGSADAAATLLALNKLWKLNYSIKKLSELGGQLGSDIYYCLNKGVGEIGGHGEKVKIITKKMPLIWGVLIIPEEKKVSTRWAYQNLDKKLIGRNLKNLNLMMKAIKEKNKKGIIENLFNDFEELMIKHFPVIKKIKNDFKKAGALNSLMAGSGLAVVGFFENKKMAEKAKFFLENKYKKVFLVKTIVY